MNRQKSQRYRRAHHSRRRIIVRRPYRGIRAMPCSKERQRLAAQGLGRLSGTAVNRISVSSTLERHSADVLDVADPADVPPPITRTRPTTVPSP